MQTDNPTCPIHGFKFVDMPRGGEGDHHGYLMKCPLKTCPVGINRKDHPGRQNETGVSQQQRKNALNIWNSYVRKNSV